METMILEIPNEDLRRNNSGEISEFKIQICKMLRLNILKKTTRLHELFKFNKGQRVFEIGCVKIGG